MALLWKNPQYVSFATSSGEDPGTLTILNFEVTPGPFQVLMIQAGGFSSANDTRPTAAPQYGGISATLVDQNSDDYSYDCTVSVYRLINPTVGVANITCPFPAQSNNAGLYVIAYVVEGVNWDSPFGTIVKTTATSSTPQAVVASELGQLVIDALTEYGTASQTPGEGQTKILGVGCGAWATGFGSSQDGKTTVDMTWTLGSSTYWRQIAIPINPAIDAGLQNVIYYLDPWDPEAQLKDRFGRIVPPWEIRERVWGRLLNLDFPTGEVPDNYIASGGYFFSEGMEYTGSGNTCRLITKTGQFEANMMRKAIGKAKG